MRPSSPGNGVNFIARRMYRWLARQLLEYGSVFTKPLYAKSRFLRIRTQPAPDSITLPRSSEASKTPPDHRRQEDLRAMHSNM
jgi:hypothetical protein